MRLDGNRNRLHRPAMSEYDHNATLEAAFAAISKGNLAEAAKHARLATEQEPEDAEGWSVLGLALSGDDGLEALTHAVTLEPGQPRWHLHLGQGLSQRGQLDMAEKAFSMAAESSRGHPQAMTAWADSLMALGRFGDAAQVYGRVLQSAQSPELWMKAGDALTGANDTISAAEAYERAYKAEERPVELSSRLADLHIMLNHYDRAEAFNIEVLSKSPGDPDASLRAANLKRWQGDHNAALGIQREAHKAHPEHAGLIAALLDDKDESVLGAALKAAMDKGKDYKSRRSLSFALARHFDRQKNEQAAWEHARTANALYDDGLRYDPADYRSHLAKAVKAYKGMRGSGIADAAPKMIYVMGPPRCGGSLLQNILARVENVVSVGERGALLPWLMQGLDAPENLDGAASKLAQSDLAGMARAAGDAKFFVDKTSPHIFFAGLLSKIHPGATFIVPVRNKADMAVSMYFHDFPAQFLYTRTIEGISDYLDAQDDAVAAWREAGLELIEHDHDAFSADPIHKGAELFSKLGFDWSDDLLAVSERQGVTRTFSARQVTEGISQKFAGRGNRYKAFIEDDGFQLL